MIQCPHCATWIADESDNKKFKEIAEKLKVLDTDPNGVLSLRDELFLANIVERMVK
jgi:hypothetical protein